MNTNLPLDLNLPSEQEMLDTVFDHFITKGNAPSFGYSNSGKIICLYRGPNNTKCAIGLFIPDDQYIPEMESLGPGSIIKMHEPDFDQFCQRLQACHDNAVRSSSPNSFKAELHTYLSQFARRYNLTLPA